MDDFDDIFTNEDELHSSELINKYKNYIPGDKTLLTNLSIWDRFWIWIRYGIKIKKL